MNTAAYQLSPPTQFHHDRNIYVPISNIDCRERSKYIVHFFITNSNFVGVPRQKNREISMLGDSVYLFQIMQIVSWAWLAKAVDVCLNFEVFLERDFS